MQSGPTARRGDERCRRGNLTDNKRLTPAAVPRALVTSCCHVLEKYQGLFLLTALSVYRRLPFYILYLYLSNI